jgi:hypothetical protein
VAPRYKVSPKKDRTINGILFDSKTEAMRYVELGLMEKAKEIHHLELQPQYKVYINQQLFCTYTADFRYFDNRIGEWVIEDVKSRGTMLDTAFKLRKKAAELYHGVSITLYVDGKSLTKKIRRPRIKKIAPPE